MIQIHVWKTFVLDTNPWNYITVGKLFVLNKNTWNHICVCKLFVLERNIRNHLTVCKQKDYWYKSDYFFKMQWNDQI